MTSPALSSGIAKPTGPMQLLPAGLDQPLLLQTMTASLAMWGLIGTPTLGAYAYSAVLMLCVAWHVLHKAPQRLTALLIATIPAMGASRNFFFYNTPEFVYGLAFLLWYEHRRSSVRELMGDKLVRGLIFFGAAYWALSWLITGSHNSNMRVIDLVLAACGIQLIYREVKIFRTAMLGLGLCVLCEGAAFLAYGGRLGAGETEDGGQLGNPITLGVPLALLFLLSLVQGGRLLEVKDSPLYRYGLMLAAALALLLSTSRGSWLVALTGLAVITLFERAQRGTILACCLLLACATAALLQTERGAVLDSYLDKTFNSELSLDKRTTGRMTQWRAFPEMLAASPVWGHGPGKGREVAAEYAGRYLALHSLYLQVGAESGLIGIGLLIWFVVVLLRRGWEYAMRFGEPVPLMAGLAYLALGLSVSGFDLNAGAFLGLALLKPRGRLWRVRSAILMPEEDPSGGTAWTGSAYPKAPGTMNA